MLIESISAGILGAILGVILGILFWNKLRKDTIENHSVLDEIIYDSKETDIFNLPVTFNQEYIDKFVVDASRYNKAFELANENVKQKSKKLEVKFN